MNQFGIDPNQVKAHPLVNSSLVKPQDFEKNMFLSSANLPKQNISFCPPIFDETKGVGLDSPLFENEVHFWF